MGYVFGKSIALSFSALDGADEPVAATLVSARLYKLMPSNVQAEDSTAALGGFEENVTTSAAGTRANELVITFSALTDPYPFAGQGSYETYYAAVNFRYQALAPIQTKVVALKIRRADAITSRITINAAAVKVFDAKLGVLKVDAWIDAKVALAVKIVLRRMRAADVERYRIEESDLDDAALFLSAQLCAVELISQPGDPWDQKARLYKDFYDQIWAQEEPRIDANHDEQIEPTERVNQLSGMLIR